MVPQFWRSWVWSVSRHFAPLWPLLSPRLYPDETRPENILQETVAEPHPEVETILGAPDDELLEVVHSIFKVADPFL